MSAAASSGLKPLLEVRGLVCQYRLGGLLGARSVLRALHAVDLQVGYGEAVGLVGESGSGKSTLARAVLRLMQPTAGEIWFEGRPLHQLGERELRPLRRRMQIVFQDPYTSLDPRMRVADILAEPLDIYGLVRGPERLRRAEQLLELVGLPERSLYLYPHQLSGGQRQRVAIARALALEPQLLVCDEPLSSLDASVRGHVLGLLQQLQRRLGLGLLFISHDLSVVQGLAGRVVVLFEGRIVEQGATEELYARPFHPYTRALLDAVPSVDPAEQRARLERWQRYPAGQSVRDGCRYRSRCPLANDTCAAREPSLQQVAPGRLVACHHWEQAAQLSS